MQIALEHPAVLRHGVEMHPIYDFCFCRQGILMMGDSATTRYTAQG